MTEAERERAVLDLAEVFVEAAVRTFFAELDEEMRKERERQPRDEREQHSGGADAL